MRDFKKIATLLQCLRCKGDLLYVDNKFICIHCNEEYKIIENIPRFVPESYWALDNNFNTIQEKTKNYFGFEWDYFKDWGFIKDENVPDDKLDLYKGGRISDRVAAFNSKCRLLGDDLKEGKLILDAGCGNGRYTYEAALRGGGLVFGVDIGYGSVNSAFSNTKELENVIIMQCDLFNLPFKNEIIDSCFSNGVLMHTGNAEKAFNEIARVINVNGIFIAHLYNKLNPIWEINDYLIRLFTLKLSISKNLKFARLLSRISRIINKLPNGFERINYFMRLQPSVIHMYDWYSAPIATHHKYDELQKWFFQNNFDLLDEIPKRGVWKHPWSINLKGRKK